MRERYVIGNWKMNPVSARAARRLFVALSRRLPRLKRTTVVVAPPFPYLALGKGFSRFTLGGQDAFYFGPGGAYTGEVSLEMLADLGVRLVIVGHSERREYVGETNEVVNKKLKAVLASGMKAVLCVGEREREPREAALIFLKRQVEEGVRGLTRSQCARLLVAYEPVWALSLRSGGRVAPPEHAFRMALYIRKIITTTLGSARASSVPVLYGGSVSAASTADFLRDGWLGGLLVGGKSLDPKEFALICLAADHA